MKRLYKNRRGFTLVEMMVVIGIIVILSAFSFLAVSTYLNKASEAEANISSQQESFNSAQDDINQKFVDFGY